MKRSFVLICAALVGCAETVPVAAVPGTAAAPEVAQARALVVYDFFDPSSPLFRNERVYALENGDKVICGEVNGKNRMGAYVGFSPFYIRYGIEAGEVAARTIRTEVGATIGCNQLRDTGTIALPNPA